MVHYPQKLLKITTSSKNAISSSKTVNIFHFSQYNIFFCKPISQMFFISYWNNVHKCLQNAPDNKFNWFYSADLAWYKWVHYDLSFISCVTFKHSQKFQVGFLAAISIQFFSMKKHQFNSMSQIIPIKMFNGNGLIKTICRWRSCVLPINVGYETV